MSPITTNKSRTTKSTKEYLYRLQRIVDNTDEEDDLHDYQIKCLHDTAWCRQLMGRLYNENKVEQHFGHLKIPEVSEEELAQIKEKCSTEGDVEKCVEEGKREAVREKTINLMVASAQEEGRHSGKVNSTVEWATLFVGAFLTVCLVGVIIVFFFSRSDTKDTEDEGGEGSAKGRSGRSGRGALSKRPQKKSYKDKSSKKGKSRRKKQ